MGSAFAASVISLVRIQASTFFRECYSWHHIYKQIWRLLVGEILTLELEEGNNHDKFAVSLLKHATILGHVPREFLWMFWHFLRHAMEDWDYRVLLNFCAPLEE